MSTRTLPDVGALLADAGWHVDRSEWFSTRYHRDTREILIVDDYASGRTVARDGGEEVMVGWLGYPDFRERLLRWAFRPEIERARWHMVEALKQMERIDLHEANKAYKRVNGAQSILAGWLGVPDTTDPERPKGVR